MDLGPGAGVHGGELVAAGTLPEILSNKHSLTAQYLTGELAIPIPKKRNAPSEERGWLEVLGAKENNLRNLDARIPLGTFTAITGVSGSAGGSSAFSALTGGTNTSAAMLVETGASLWVTGSGNVSCATSHSEASRSRVRRQLATCRRRQVPVQPHGKHRPAAARSVRSLVHEYHSRHDLRNGMQH